jgi:hypothetical protein
MLKEYNNSDLYDELVSKIKLHHPHYYIENFDDHEKKTVSSYDTTKLDVKIWLNEGSSKTITKTDFIEKLNKDTYRIQDSRFYISFDEIPKAKLILSNKDPVNPDAYKQGEIERIIEKECDAIKELLLEKNRKYGNSALSPLRIFSKADCIEQINVRIDDKLSRIKNAQDDEDEDVEKDLIGYMILKRVAKRLNKDDGIMVRL